MCQVSTLIFFVFTYSSRPFFSAEVRDAGTAPLQRDYISERRVGREKRRTRLCTPQVADTRFSLPRDMHGP